MSKNKKYHLSVITDYKTANAARTPREMSRICYCYEVAEMSKVEEELLWCSLDTGKVILEDMDSLHPYDKIVAIKNMLVVMKKLSISIEYWTNDLNMLRVFNNCIRAHQAKDNLGYPPINPKYLEVYKMVGTKKESILINDFIEYQRTNCYDVENKLLMDNLNFMIGTAEKEEQKV